MNLATPTQNQLQKEIPDSRRQVDRDLITYFKEDDITVIAYTLLADGSLLGKSRFRPDRGNSVLEQVAQEVDNTPAQVAFNWCLSKPNIIVRPKSDSIERTVPNCQG